MIGKVVVYVEDKDRLYQITGVDRSECPELPYNFSLYDEYEDSYLEKVTVNLREWLGRQISLTDQEQKVERREVKLSSIYEFFYKVI